MEEPASWPTGRLLTVAARLVEQSWTMRLTEAGLTHAGVVVLDHLQSGPSSQNAIAARVRVRQQTMSRTIDRLAREGLVTKTPDPLDLRRTIVAITEAGMRAWEQARALETELFPAIDDPDAFRDALTAIIGAFRDPS